MVVLQGATRHFVTTGTDSKGNFLRMDHVLDAISARLETAKHRMEALHLEVLDAKSELEKPFPQEEILREKSLRLVELNAELDMDASKTEPEVPEKESKTEPEF